MLPHNLLNRVNKDLKAKVDTLASQVNNQKAVARLEEEVIANTQLQVNEAKQKLHVAKTIHAQSEHKVDSEDLAQRDTLREVNKLKMDLVKMQGASKDWLQKVAAHEVRVEETRAKVHQAQDAASKNEMNILGWMEDNRLTENAANVASAIITEGEQKLAAQRREAEILTVKTRKMDEEVWEGANVVEQLHAEINDAKNRREQLEVEKRDTLAQIKEAARRDEELKEQHAKIMDNKKDLRNDVLQKRADADAVAAELKQLEAEVEKVKRHQFNVEAERNRAVAAIQGAEKALGDAELDLRLAEQETLLLNQKRSKTLAELEMAKLHLQEKREHCDRTEQKKAIIEAQYAELTKATESSEEETAAHFRVIENYKTEVHQQLGMIERGMDIIRQQNAKHIQMAQEGEHFNDEIIRLRKIKGQCDGKVQALQKRLTELDATSKTIDEDADIAAEKVAEARGIATDASAEERKRKQVEIEELKDHLEQVEAALRQSKRAVSSAQSALRTQLAENETLEAAAKGTHTDLDGMRTEIEVLYKTIDQLAQDKQEKAAQAEDIFWRIEAWKSKAEHQLDGLVEQKKERNALESEARMHFAEIQVTVEANLVELHAHEEERRKLGQRLMNASQQQKILKSRYESLMEAMERKVAPPPEDFDANAAEKAAQGALVVARQDLVPFNGKTAAGEEEVTPEDLHARHLLHRALHREELLKKGDSLDENIVQAEKDLKRLDDAYTKMKQNYSEGFSQPVLMIEGYDPVQEAEEEAFLQEVRGRLQAMAEEAGAAHPYQEELLRWTQVYEENVVLLDEVREKQRKKIQQLVEARAERDNSLQQLRALQREEEKLSKANVKESMHSHKMGQALRVKSSGFYSHPNAAKVLHDTKNLDAVEQCYQKLQMLIVHTSRVQKNDEMYFQFRRLSDKYGLSKAFDALSKAPEGGRVPQTSAAPSSRTRQPPGTQQRAASSSSRPASSASSTASSSLLAQQRRATTAMTDTTNISVGGMSVTSKTAAAPPPRSSSSSSSAAQKKAASFEPLSRRPASKALVDALSNHVLQNPRSTTATTTTGASSVRGANSTASRGTISSAYRRAVSSKR